MRNVPHIYAIGDIVSQRCWHIKPFTKATLPLKTVPATKPTSTRALFQALPYTSPEVAWVGETSCLPNFRPQNHQSQLPMGCFRPCDCQQFATMVSQKLIFDSETGRIIGGGIVGPNGGDMIGEICLAIEMGCDAADIGQTITHTNPRRIHRYGCGSGIGRMYRYRLEKKRNKFLK